jgi:hypothetical protein
MTSETGRPDERSPEPASEDPATNPSGPEGSPEGAEAASSGPHAAYADLEDTIAKQRPWGAALSEELDDTIVRPERARAVFDAARAAVAEARALRAGADDETADMEETIMAPGVGGSGDEPTLPPQAPFVILREPEIPPADLVPPPSAGPAPRWLPAPTIFEVDPPEGPVHAETRVTLRGQHLYRESIVRFEGLIAMTVGAHEPRELVVRTPLRERPGPVEVSVQNPGAPLVVLSAPFRYVPLAPPTVTGVAPHAGAPKGGTEISVTGSGFVPGSVVLVDGVRAKTTFVDGTTIDAVTPPGKSGAMVDVAVENPDGRRANMPRAFAYDDRYAK